MAYWHVCILGLILTQVWSVDCEDEIKSKTNKYDNHTLVRLIPENERQFEAIRKFQDSSTEIMKLSYGHNDSLDLLVPANRLQFVKQYAAENKLQLEEKQNYGRSFTRARLPKRRLFNGFNIFDYNSNTGIQEYLDSVSRRHPNLVTLKNLGNSYEGRKMTLVQISSNPGAQNPIIFIDAGVHAREWVAPAMALYIIHRLTSDPEARRDLDGVDWYILPLVNPDGYEFTRSSHSNRLWRKTRSRTSEHCFGVDGNRNYGFHWAESGVSSNPCDRETFAGSKPFSEAETRMVKHVMSENANRIKLYVSLHSYGNYLVYPWGYTGDFLPKDWRRLDRLARKVSDSIRAAGGKPLTVMSAGKWYPAAGGSDDYAFGAVGVPYSYTMELTTGYEFEFPQYLLREVLPQFYEGFSTFGSEIRREFGKTRLKRELRCPLSKA